MPCGVLPQLLTRTSSWMMAPKAQLQGSLFRPLQIRLEKRSGLALSEMSTDSMEESEGCESEGCESMRSESLGSESFRSESEEIESAESESEGSECGGSEGRGGGADVECSERGDSGDQLLPGIPNEIAVDQICTKLSWKVCCILSKVSRNWRRAVLSQHIYDARVRSQSTETLLVHSHPFELDFSCEQLYVYSGSEKCCYELPRIQGVNRGIPWECQCVSLDGKIYVLGGGTGYGYGCDGEDDEDKKEVFSAVYSLDLVGPGERPASWRGSGRWKRCASMQEGRIKFGCGVIGGKIYVFGGASHYGPVRGCEVYDPKANAWSPIRPMKRLRFGHQVATLGDVCLVYGGEVFDQDYAGGRGSGIRLLDEDGWRVPNNSVREAVILEAYHPVEDEWRDVEPFRNHDSESIFMADRKFHLMTQGGIYVQDTETNSWKERYSNSFPGRRRSEHYTVTKGATVVVSDALYVNMQTRRGEVNLCEGRGFGSDNLEVVWEELDCEDSKGEGRGRYGDVKCPIKI